ncbi:sulfur carrier protein ThiS [Euzebya tangerina]|uniref:sulfur carrier protein ThiS n=1 Tax=Euzebya tangerina TaxID=591198 RepID=UPI000E31BE6A|nr:sulfur carrier protein ThiS [Euzebya tangerina]
MMVLVNGEETVLAAGSTLADVVSRLGHDPSRPGVAAAVDGVVVPRAAWSDTPVLDDQRVEVLTAVQGGAR